MFELRGGRYGSPRITADLRDAGWWVSKNTVAALMRQQVLADRAVVILHWNGTTGQRAVG